MELLDELQQLLLDGLPEDERRQTVDTMAKATAAKLAHLRSTTWRPTPPVCDLARGRGRRLRSKDS